MLTRILVVDDEPRWVNFARRELSHFEVVVVQTLSEALAELRTDEFDLIIASSRKMDVIREIVERYPNKQVMVMTTRPTMDEAVTAYEYGAALYATKSFGPHALIEKIKGLVPLLSHAI